MDIVLLGIFGMIFGSFGSVLLWRLQDTISWQTITSILVGRSHCPGCNKTLTVGQLVPLFGRLWQQGKCFRCHKSISTLYPVLEVVSGIVFVLWGILTQGDWGVMNILLLVIRWLLGLLLVWDMYTYELHFPLFVILLSVVVLQFFFDPSVVAYLPQAFAFFVSFGGIYLFGKRYSKIRFGTVQETFGFGDVMLAPVLGLMIGVSSQYRDVVSVGGSFATHDLFMVVLGFVLGSCLIGLLYYAVVSLCYYYMQKDRADTLHETGSPMIPFFPAMIVCYWLIVFFI